MYLTCMEFVDIECVLHVSMRPRRIVPGSCNDVLSIAKSIRVVLCPLTGNKWNIGL